MCPANPPRKRIALLGATGSVGTAAVDVVLAHPEAFDVVAVVAGTRGGALLDIGRRVSAERMVLLSDEAEAALRPSVRPGDPELRAGQAAVLEIVREPTLDIVLQATSGAAGLEATLAAVRAGKHVALANKESLVVAGPLLMREARQGGATIVPVDSEHSAIFQCLRGGQREEVRRVILTASGGPFRGRSTDSLRDITAAEALNHPTWAMGKRITIDSATLMNKALEVIEARWLFDLEPDQIEVVVHPQSVIHSMVEFVDGSVVAQMGPPDMRLPIRFALGWPARLPAQQPRFSWRDYQNLTFEAPDTETFPALRLGFEAAARGGTAGAALNAADEVAVSRFLAGDLPFTGIASLCERALANHSFTADPTLDDLLAVDGWARDEARQVC